MADDIVVLDSDSDSDEISKSIWQQKTKSAQPIRNVQTNKHGNTNNGKRKLQSTMEDEEPIAKRPTIYAEEIHKSDGANTAISTTAKLPQIVAVETLATPSATPPLQLLASPPRTPKDMHNISPKTIMDTIDYDATKSANTTDKSTARRIKPTTLLKDSDEAWQELRQKRLQSVSESSLNLQKPSELIVADLQPAAVMDLTNSPETKAETNVVNEVKTKETRIASIEKPALEKEYEELINVCRKADTSADMQKLIDTKLLKYYYSVHPDFLKSRGFRKTVTAVTERIRAEPDLVYYNLKTVVDELNVRRKCKDVVITNDEASPSAGGNGVTSSATIPNKHTEAQIKKLNKALYKLKKRIYALEESEVDWEDEDSAYLQVERFKKRACQIYEKICDLTGESKNARRLVKKPIQFSGTAYPVFNKTLQAYINRTRQFPDFYDVLRTLEHCNKQYDLKLANFEVKRIAQEAFIKVGKTLQARRKNDLYETVSHFTADMEDPAKSDPELMAKLNENKKAQTKISQILDTFARAQDDPDAAAALLNLKKEREDSVTTEYKENGDVGVVDDNDDKQKENSNKLQSSRLASDDESDDDDDEDDENLETLVDNLAKDNTIDLSDDEVDMEETKDATTAQQENKLKSNSDDCNEKSNKEKTNSNNVQANVENTDLKLTENNNIMRSKTCNETEQTKEIVNALATAASTPPINDNVHKKNESTNKSDNNSLNSSLLKEVITTTTTTTNSTSISTSKTNFKDLTTPLRTIAEIVISDEE